MEINEDHVRPRNNSLRGSMHDIEDAFGTPAATTHRVRRIDANRHASQSSHYRHLSEVNKVPMRVAHVRLNTAESKDHFPIAFAGEIFRGVKRFTHRDPKTTFEQNRKLLLSANYLQQLKILRIPRTDLNHHSRRLARTVECFVDFINLRFMGDLNGHDFDSILAG